MRQGAGLCKLLGPRCARGHGFARTVHISSSPQSRIGADDVQRTNCWGSLTLLPVGAQSNEAKILFVAVGAVAVVTIATKFKDVGENEVMISRRSVICKRDSQSACLDSLLKCIPKDFLEVATPGGQDLEIVLRPKRKLTVGGSIQIQEIRGREECTRRV